MTFDWPDGPQLEFRFLRIEEPTLLEHTHTSPGSWMRYELDLVGTGTRLRATYFVPNPDEAIRRGDVVGGHYGFDRLQAALAGRPIPFDMDAFATLQHRYAAQSAAAGAPLLTSMTGKASPAKPAVGDRPVFDYIASLPEPQRSIAQAIDDLAARTLPGLERSVKWGMAYYGVGDGWCFSSGAFVGHVKLMFINGATLLEPVPPVTPTGMGKATRGVELETLQDLDEPQAGLWMKQVTAAPGVGRK
jgi:hypothetical protein